MRDRERLEELEHRVTDLESRSDAEGETVAIVAQMADQLARIERLEQRIDNLWVRVGG